jgi:lysyl-tRNA synthetase class I
MLAPLAMKAAAMTDDVLRLRKEVERFDDVRTVPQTVKLRWRQVLDRLEHVRTPVSQPKKKSGRPRKWLGRVGYELLVAVNSICAERRRGFADAIRILRSRSPAKWGSYDQRELQTRFQEARNFWLPYLKNFAEFRAIHGEIAAIQRSQPQYPRNWAKELTDKFGKEIVAESPEEVVTESLAVA